MPTYCLNIEIDAAYQELAIAVCYKNGTLGCFEESSENKVKIKSYFPTLRQTQAAEYGLYKNANAYYVTLEIAPQHDWNENWRRQVQPVALVNGIWVSPLWRRPPLKANQKWIIIEPKMAFGTAHHESTRLAAWGIFSLKNNLRSNPKGLDVGTGTGILCFASNIFFKKGVCIGLDNDPICHENLAENAKINKNCGCGKSLFFIGEIAALKMEAKFDYICMNLLFSQAVGLLEKLSVLLIDKGWLVWSGLLAEERQPVLKEVDILGFRLIREKVENQWWACVLRKR